MKYRPTPINTVCGLLVLLAIYYALNPGSEGWGFLLALSLVLIITLGLIVDFFLQKFVHKYLLAFGIELLLLSGIYFVYCWGERTKVLIIPDDLKSQFIVTIYGVENSPKLPNGWNYEIIVPENGILLTSSSYDWDLPETKMKTYSGINLNSAETELGWIRVVNDKFDCGGKTYEYQFWMVDSSCCSYSSREIESFKGQLLRQFCER